MLITEQSENTSKQTNIKNTNTTTYESYTILILEECFFEFFFYADLIGF